MERHKSLNIHVGEILKEDIIDPANLTIGDASKLLNTTRLTLSKIINGKSSITPDMALRISYVFGGSADFWLRLQRKYDLAKAEDNFHKDTLTKHSYN
ncbi:addiction module antidote protein, HigA family [Chryseobacterium carnipullorum]|uniref:HigA family addiction module antitoxin n=1 Tax=Chryseobacterium carnipullorum TaxID=1124835 RepID=UPI00092241E5|nr:HigA family addiction module antitoxin [Chryseobacterium carnipullorum]SHN07184.1 addiction module antidote protein, HigA family [Chryseobacterium carnipullorum]